MAKKKKMFEIKNFLRLLGRGILIIISYRIVLLIIGIIIGIGGTFIYIQIYGLPSEQILQNVAMVEESKKILNTY